MVSQPLLRIKSARLCNEAIDGYMDDGEQLAMVTAAARKVEELFDVLQIDHRNDHNTRDTPKRVAKMFVQEMLRGRYNAPPEITDFDNADGYSGLIVTGPIEVRSTCAHHLMPIYGEAFIGILPSPEGRIIGLSKYDRIVDYFCARFQIQEELVQQIGRFIMDKTNPRGLAVRISAVHMCKTQRGIRATHRGRMVNSAFFGEMQDDKVLRQEFLQECAIIEGHGR
ncbi:MAG TPA: GTP cyclohydrolase I [Microvirga sp.]|jgi:GTP cyclohydrolase I|nr:GTP cyclohydrolase I [Microvirga sp.]